MNSTSPHKIWLKISARDKLIGSAESLPKLRADYVGSTINPLAVTKLDEILGRTCRGAAGNQKRTDAAEIGIFHFAIRDGKRKRLLLFPDLLSKAHLATNRWGATLLICKTNKSGCRLNNGIHITSYVTL